jgi:hypothetical protein
VMGGWLRGSLREERCRRHRQTGAEKHKCLYRRSSHDRNSRGKGPLQRTSDCRSLHEKGQRESPVLGPTWLSSQGLHHHRDDTLLVSREMRNPKQAPTKTPSATRPGSNQPPLLARPPQTMTIPNVHHRSRFSKFMANHPKLIVERCVSQFEYAKERPSFSRPCSFRRTRVRIWA